jgi:spore germination cell wall hydrolase CwlJ-like protein
MALPNANATNAVEFLKNLETDVLARTIWGEARGEGKEGMEAVSSVILNRVEVAKRLDGYWWGNTIIQVCQKPYQFSCWNKLDPNFKKLISVDEDDMHFATALRVARRAMLGFIKDRTYGATHYHTIAIMPDWAKGQKPTTRIGHHVFYSLVEG